MMSRLTFIAAVIVLFSTEIAKGQLTVSQSTSLLNHFIPADHTPIKLSIGNLYGSYNNTAVPAMHLNAMSAPGDAIWTGAVTSQSFNNGKFGRFYCWDVQGNLRNSYLFLDISGKRKRGLKLAFSKHRLLFDNKNRIAF